MKCKSYGCTNHTHEGTFVGDFCAPCWKAITEGPQSVGHGTAWFYDMNEALKKQEFAQRDLSRAIDMLFIYGVPEQRTKTVANGIDVLVTRYIKEINALRGELGVTRTRIAELEKMVDVLQAYKIKADNLLDRTNTCVADQADQLRVAKLVISDMLSGWKYIRETHGDLYGVGWDRAQAGAEGILAKLEGVG